MTIKDYNKAFFLKMFFMSFILFCFFCFYSVFSYIKTMEEYDVSKLEKTNFQISSNISTIKEEISTKKRLYMEREASVLNINRENQRLTNYINVLNTIGINNELFRLKLESIRPNVKYINQADVVLDVQSASKVSNAEISTIIFNDTLLSDDEIKEEFKAYKNNFEIFGNKIYFTLEKQVKR